MDDPEIRAGTHGEPLDCWGGLPVAGDALPLGWEPGHGFLRRFPTDGCGFRLVRRVALGCGDLEPNRLFLGDNLRVMRQLPAASVDLVYADPPFFSGRRHTAPAGDGGGPRAFSDVWSAGLPGYLVWLNARLVEMRRLLRPTGSIMVHCDIHASHYIKVEMDKIFGAAHMQNEIIWSYRSGGGTKRRYGRKHDTIFWYTRSRDDHVFNPDDVRVPYDAVIAPSRRSLFHHAGKVSGSVWDISRPPNHSKEWVGYPTQKPEALLERIVRGHSRPGGVVADFFCGSGTTACVAQRLGRRWLACDDSPAAVDLTARRLGEWAGTATGGYVGVRDGAPARGCAVDGGRCAVPDFTVEECRAADPDAPAQERHGAPDPP